MSGCERLVEQPDRALPLDRLELPPVVVHAELEPVVPGDGPRLVAGRDQVPHPGEGIEARVARPAVPDDLRASARARELAPTARCSRAWAGRRGSRRRPGRGARGTRRGVPGSGPAAAGRARRPRSRPPSPGPGPGRRPPPWRPGSSRAGVRRIRGCLTWPEGPSIARQGLGMVLRVRPIPPAPPPSSATACPDPGGGGVGNAQ